MSIIKEIPASELYKYPENPKPGRKAWIVEPIYGEDSIRFNPKTGRFERYFKVIRNGRK